MLGVILNDRDVLRHVWVGNYDLAAANGPEIQVENSWHIVFAGNGRDRGLIMDVMRKRGHCFSH